MSLTNTSLTTMRPTFRLQLHANLPSVREKLSSILGRPAWHGRGQIFGDYAEFHIAESAVRYWSPHLAVHLEPIDHESQAHHGPTSQNVADVRSLQTDANDNSTTLLLGRFAPRQNVWMLVWIIYLAMAFFVFFAAVYAGVQYWMNQTPWAVAVGLLAGLVIVGLHLISKIGQSLSMDQMLELRQRLNDLLAEAEITISEPTE